jgi:hypothetical protein
MSAKRTGESHIRPMKKTKKGKAEPEPDPEPVEFLFGNYPIKNLYTFAEVKYLLTTQKEQFEKMLKEKEHTYAESIAEQYASFVRYSIDHLERSSGKTANHMMSYIS